MSRRISVVGVCFAWLTTAVVLCGCGDAGPSNPALIVLPGARSMFHDKNENGEQISYRIQEKYPAKAALAQIRKQLSKQGWKPLKEDYLNPGLPSSHVTGWDYYSDSTSGKEQSVRSWIADWTNSQGDVVRYSLYYRSPADMPTSDSVLIACIFKPSKQAKAERKYVLEEMAKEKQQEQRH